LGWIARMKRAKTGAPGAANRSPEPLRTAPMLRPLSRRPVAEAA
jgi:hypothetical protein